MVGSFRLTVSIIHKHTRRQLFAISYFPDCGTLCPRRTSCWRRQCRFSEIFEDPSRQLFFPQIPCSARMVTLISDSLIYLTSLNQLYFNQFLLYSLTYIGGLNITSDCTLSWKNCMCEIQTTGYVLGVMSTGRAI